MAALIAGMVKTADMFLSLRSKWGNPNHKRVIVTFYFGFVDFLGHIKELTEDSRRATAQVMFCDAFGLTTAEADDTVNLAIEYSKTPDGKRCMVEGAMALGQFMAGQSASPGNTRLMELLATAETPPTKAETDHTPPRLLTASGSPTEAELETWYQHGLKHAFGEETPRDSSEAVKWYRKAAERGHPKAQYNLGNCYYNGDGVSKDAAEAVRWYRKAAEQGSAKAQFTLGACYETGEGVPQNYLEAVKLIRLAAEQGHADAQFTLGSYCYTGNGVPKDREEAVRWIRLAAEQGHATAQYFLDKMKR